MMCIAYWFVANNFEYNDGHNLLEIFLLADENLHYDFDERQEVWKELFSPYIKKEKGYLKYE